MNDQELETEEDLPQVACCHCDFTGAASQLTTIEERPYCEDCRNDEFTQIDGDWISLEDCIFDRIAEEYVYAEDTHTCEDCGDRFHYENIESVNGGNASVCRNCLDGGDYCAPVDADGFYLIENCEYDDDSGDWYAYGLPEPESRYLHSYSTNVLHVLSASAYLGHRLRGDIGSSLVFGVELETGARDGHDADSIAETLCEYTDFQAYGICKEDGSISGAEMVTLPGTLEAHVADYSWDDWCRTLQPIARGYHAGVGTGIHIHINRAAVSALTLGKMLVFTNADVNAEFLSTIAQRDVSSVSWCRRNPLKFDKVGKAAADPCNGKYSILNVTSRTIECRMFRSSLLPERILKNLEFCHALVKFCESASARNLTANYFQSFVVSRKSTYPHLAKFIDDRITEENQECA